jgi:hypothetical protein
MKENMEIGRPQSGYPEKCNYTPGATRCQGKRKRLSREKTNDQE